MDIRPGSAAPRPGGPPLTVTVRRAGRGWVLRPAGELDRDTAQPFADALDTALATPHPYLVVDCSGLGFCDSTGLNLLLRARSTALEGGGDVVLTGPTSMIERMLEVTGTGAVLRVVDGPVDGPDGGPDGAAAGLPEGGGT